MRPAILAIFIASLVIPNVADAAWWNPFSWRKTLEYVRPVDPKTSATTTSTTTMEVAQKLDLSAVPTVDDLLKRIAELEDKLEKALAQKEILSMSLEASKSTSKPVAQTPSPASGISEKDLSAKVKPAIVLVETATSSGSGVLIDSSGRILLDAHTIWNEDTNKAVIGAAEVMTVTLSNGTKKSAKLVGIDEARDIALIQLNDKAASSYLRMVHDSALKVGDKAYVASFPPVRGGTGGESFVPGLVTQKASVVEITSDKRPLDNGGAIVNAKGEFVAIPNKSSCKVLEEMEKCLKYKITAKVVRDVVAKLQDGMRLYKDKKFSSKFEELVRGQLQGVYANTEEGTMLLYASESVSGKNSFDNFNSKFSNDEGGDITRIYLNKLKLASERMYKAMDFLKTQAYNLSIFLINESSTIEDLGDYQQKVLKQIEAFNSQKFKEYEAKVNFWTKKKNEYDSYLLRSAEATQDYLMAEGVLLEKEARYLESERKKIIDMFSGETLKIF